MMVAVASAAVACGALVGGFRWFLYPHVRVTIFNETSSAVHEVRVKCFGGENSAERIEAGGSASVDIQCGGEDNVYVTFRDSRGAQMKDHLVHGSRDNAERGYLNVYLTKRGVRVVEAVYSIPIEYRPWHRRVPGTGPIIVR
jgi:hypothetical protein